LRIIFNFGDFNGYEYKSENLGESFSKK